MTSTTSATAPVTVHRADYQPPAFWVDTVDLTFDLDPQRTRVLNKMRIRRNINVPEQPLRLQGVELNLARVLLNGQATAFKLEGTDLLLMQPPQDGSAFDVEIFTTCAPDSNTELMGLYLSQDCFFTQCEAEGFRRITYFPDRPDVMAVYTVTLRAHKTRYPVLLSNGNLVAEGQMDDGRHFATWHDPHKKPSYLFALVAGNLVAREQRITSRSGREHLLQIYVRPGDLDQTEHAMHALMHSVAWDEARFGLPLDLERFMVVATSDFNMGAMENKGLNIFNTRYVLAKPSTATDADFAAIESVIGHEYFHNWTGNRITCRDWFQLSLKEGLTVFRDQEFSQDMAGTSSARAVCRIADVRDLRARQFSEDSGPMAHPVRPDAYQEISNFYTSTIYEKGAEVVRMYQTLLERDGFRRGMDLYFQRHDGQAVTCDDFAQAMADANPDSTLTAHLELFKRWYSQAGTPTVHASGSYNAQDKTWTLTLTQRCPPTPGQPSKQPMLIPIRMGLLDDKGQPIALRLHGEPDDMPAPTERILVLTEATQHFTFCNVQVQPTPSLLRQFSAPIHLYVHGNTTATMCHLLAYDTDPFNRWEAAQSLYMDAIQRTLAQQPAATQSHDGLLCNDILDALRQILRNEQLHPAFRHLVLTLPDEAGIAELSPAPINPVRISQIREALRRQLAHALHADWQHIWDVSQTHAQGAYQPDPLSAGWRALANLALDMLCTVAQAHNDPVWPGRAWQRCKTARNMTDHIGALRSLLHANSPLVARALEHFYQQYQHEALVIDKWFALQATRADQPDTDTDNSTLASVQRLMQHPDFRLTNPNRVRSLIGAYCHSYSSAFHRVDGAGYAFWAQQVLALDAINAQIAARLARALEHWKRLDNPWRSAARTALEQVAASPNLSVDTREVISRTLAD